MKLDVAGAWRRKLQVGLLVALAVVPWVWSTPFVPFWVSLTALSLAAIGISLALRVFRETEVIPEASPNPAAEDAGDSGKRSVRRASRGLRRLLARWAGITQTTTSDLQETQAELQEVIEHSESAVLAISKNFRNITSRSSQQISYAMGLLQSTRGSGDVGSGDHGGEEMSLPEYIRAYEVLLNFGLDRLQDFARDCLQLVEQWRRGDRHQDVDEKLVERIRSLAQESQTDVEQMRADASHLSGGMVIKNQQVTDVLRHINDTAQEIRRDVNQLVIAMQFQDITQQKLERLRGPLLSEIVKSLNSITDETRVLSRQLKTGTISTPDGASVEVPISEAEEAVLTPRVEADKEARAKQRPAESGGSQDSSVELF
jgi:hypothetical protein